MPNRPLVIELLVLAVVTVGLYFVLSSVEAFEWLYEVSRAHEDWDLDELIILVLILPVPLAMFALRRVRERARLTEQRLELERKLAHNRKLDALGTLAGGVAHELNNRLLPVMTLGEVVRNHLPEGSDDREKMDVILESCVQARNTLGQILAFSRKDRPNGDSLDVNEALEAVMFFFRGALSQSSAHFSLEVEPAIGRVALSPDMLDAVVVNLLINAIDAMGTRIGSVTLGAHRIRLPDDGGEDTEDLRSGDYVRMTVADDGPGIDDAVIDQLFEPFFTTKAVGQGTGLGLSVVHGVATEAGGAVGVRSAKGRGTVFTIYLPLVNAGDG